MTRARSLFLLLGSAVAMMAFASPAAATTLTSPGGSTVSTGTSFQASNVGKVVGTPPIGNIECSKFALAGKTTNAGGAGVNVNANVEVLTFSECNATVTVLSKGTLSIAATSGGNGTVTSTGAEVTVNYLGFHCIFKTNNTNLGLIDAPSASEPNHNLLTLTGTWPRTGGSSGAFCGSTAVWHITATIKDWFLFTYIRVD